MAAGRNRGRSVDGFGFPAKLPVPPDMVFMGITDCWTDGCVSLAKTPHCRGVNVRGELPLLQAGCCVQLA